jgi:hypothetical protein
MARRLLPPSFQKRLRGSQWNKQLPATRDGESLAPSRQYRGDGDSLTNRPTHGNGAVRSCSVECSRMAGTKSEADTRHAPEREQNMTTTDKNVRSSRARKSALDDGHPVPAGIGNHPPGEEKEVQEHPVRRGLSRT